MVKMRSFLFVPLIGIVLTFAYSADGQNSDGGGLLAPDLGLHPLGVSCCCTSDSDSCPNGSNLVAGNTLVSSGSVRPRQNVGSGQDASTATCPAGRKTCCFPSKSRLRQTDGCIPLESYSPETIETTATTATLETKCPFKKIDGVETQEEDFCCTTGTCPSGSETSQPSILGLVGPRVVNNAPQCPEGTKKCCLSSNIEGPRTGLDKCLPPEGFNVETNWKQKCPENSKTIAGSKQCGQRKFVPRRGLRVGEASPEEFPWTCLILNKNDKFIGGCTIVPDNRQNDISRGTRKVITVAHKLTDLKENEEIKVRVLDYDARGMSSIEQAKPQDFNVVRFIKHPQYNPTRLSDDIAVLILDKSIDLQQYNGINAACYPACNDMFDYKFENGTGTRCWVAGWGEDAQGKAQTVQNKVDLPIFDRSQCESIIKAELTKSNPETGRKFSLVPGELCAGGEKGKDSCIGDGGSPLVCQSDTGHFHVVGLVAWGIRCAEENLPGIYVDVYNYIDFITQHF